MNNEPVQWSEEKQKSLQDLLVGRWAEDIWIFTPSNEKRRPSYLRFTLNSPSLKAEIKYALWNKFDTGRRKINARHDDLIAGLSLIMEWLNHYTPPVQSLMEKALAEWELSFREYLKQSGRFKYRKDKALLANQEFVERIAEDRRITLLRRIFAIVCEAYDDRPETEREIWDMRKMGLAVNLAGGIRCLNFTLIAQPWLRHIALEFMRYNLAVHSPGDCYAKLGYILKFSEFLTKRYSEAHISMPVIDRALVVQYISFLREEKVSDVRRLHLLSGLRIFFETCAFRLEIAEVPRERLIYNDDFPKIPLGQSREIPDGVLAQLREHLNTLDTPILRMVVILLECGLRINELCSLPLNCLTCDEKQHWFLHFYQIKAKQEQNIPLVEETVIKTIQTQQQFIREKYGLETSYLFPSIKSHLLPFRITTFTQNLNKWAREHNIRDAKGGLYHFETHQFRHTVGMRLINDDVPIEVISRLFGHHSVRMTQIYARKRDEQVAEDLERAGRKRKTVDYQGQIVRGDSRANAPGAQLLRKGIRGQTLPLGGCGRLFLLGDCEHANKCLTCPSWLTSTEDLPGLKAFYGKAIRLKQRALEVNNSIVLQNQDKIIPLLSIRINSLQAQGDNDPLSTDELLSQLRIDLARAEAGQEEAQEAGFIQAVKYLGSRIVELKARIASLEEAS